MTHISTTPDCRWRVRPLGNAVAVSNPLATPETLVLCNGVTARLEPGSFNTIVL